MTIPGFTEIDLVAHCGSLGDGEFVHSLNLTDIHTTWVETAAVLGKGQAAVQGALAELRQALPFRLRGIDSDNGSEFINQHLLLLCQKASGRLRWTSAPATGQPVKQSAGQQFVRRGDGGRHMAFRPHREPPAA